MTTSCCSARRRLRAVFKTTAALRERFGPTESGTRRSPSRPSRARPCAPPWPRCARREIMFADFYAPAAIRWPTRSRSPLHTRGQVTMPLVLRARTARRALIPQPALPVRGELGHVRPRAQDRLPCGACRAFAALRRDPGHYPAPGLRAQGAVRAQGGGAPPRAPAAAWPGPHRPRARDVTLVGLSITVWTCLAAADELAVMASRPTSSTCARSSRFMPPPCSPPSAAPAASWSWRRTRASSLGSGDRGDRRGGGVR